LAGILLMIVFVFRFWRVNY